MSLICTAKHWEGRDEMSILHIQAVLWQVKELEFSYQQIFIKYLVLYLPMFQTTITIFGSCLFQMPHHCTDSFHDLDRSKEQDQEGRRESIIIIKISSFSLIPFILLVSRYLDVEMKRNRTPSIILLYHFICAIPLKLLLVISLVK